MAISWGQSGSGLFCRVEQTFRFQFLFQLLEGQLQGPQSLGFHDFHDELVFTSGFVHTDATLTEHLKARFGHKTHVAVLRTEKNRPDLTLLVLQGKVVMTGSRNTEIGDLPFHPDKAIVGFEESFDPGIELTDCKNAGFFQGLKKHRPLTR